MVRYSFVIFIIFLETLYCVSGNDSFNSKLSGKTEIMNSDISENNGFMFENNETPLEKNIEKRRLFFNDGETNSPGAAGSDFENNEFPVKRRSNYNITETETASSEYDKEFNDWENKQFSFSAEPDIARNPPEYLLRKPNQNQNFEWEERRNVFETKPLRWNEEKFIEPNLQSKPNFRSRFHSNKNGIIPIFPISFNKNGPFDLPNPLNIFNPSFFLNGQELEKPTKNDDEMVEQMSPGYLRHSNINRYNENSKPFSQNICRPEKGIIINFNTDCPGTRQDNNKQMMQKYILTSQSPTQNHIQSPVQCHMQNPLQSHIQSPIQNPIPSHIQSPMQNPLQSHIQSPIQTPIQTHIQSPMQSPIQTHIQSPMQSPIQSPMQSPIQTHIQSPMQSPIQSLPEMSAFQIPDPNFIAPQRKYYF